MSWIMSSNIYALNFSRSLKEVYFGGKISKYFPLAVKRWRSTRSPEPWMSWIALSCKKKDEEEDHQFGPKVASKLQQPRDENVFQVVQAGGERRSPSNFTGLPRSFTLPALKAWFTQCRESIKPWGLFISTSHYKVPPSLPRLLKRAVNNLSYFQGNYLTITLILMAYCLITSPLLLLVVAASLIACYMLSVKNAERKLVISGKEISINQQYAAVGICSLPLYYWAGVGQAVFWVIGASCFVISIHAGLFNIDEILSQEDQMDLLVQQI